MKIAINALPIKHGGVLTVLLGLVRGLRHASRDLELSVLTSSPRTREALLKLQCAVRIDEYMTGRNAGVSFAWQNLCLGKRLRAEGTDVLLTFNHLLHNVACPQVVYHNNLRRFSRQYRSKNPLNVFAEATRDRAAQKALDRADANVFESSFLKDAAEKLLGRPARNPHVVYIGLPDSWLGECLPTGGSGSRSRRLVALTSPQPHKDNETMVRTLAELVRREPHVPWRLDVAGGVNQGAFEGIRRLAVELGVADRIDWHGYCDRGRLAGLFRNGLCLLATSQLESFAMVPLEAMAHSCPPVVANCTSMPESVGNAGLLVRPGSPTAFADAALSIASQPALREELVRLGGAWIQQFRWSNCGRQFHQLFGELSKQDSETRERIRAVA